MTEFTVVIPAKNEERLIERTLTAIGNQEGVSPNRFDVIVLANNCSDETAAVARRFARQRPDLKLDVLECILSEGDAHIGTARRMVMDAAAGRFERAGTNGIIASTDADTVVDSFWIANTISAMREVDAVTGQIDIIPDELNALPDDVRRAYRTDVRYHRTVALLEATLDPVPWDPAPRHGDHFGGSFAVKTHAYRQAGGIPAISRLEDLALYHALFEADIRVRHAIDVRVETSARGQGRILGGFATHLAELAERSNVLVDDPRITLETISARAFLRQYWAGDAGSESNAARIDALRVHVDRARPFGESWHRAERELQAIHTNYAMVVVDFAQEALRRALASANVARPTRTSAASGAG